MDSSHIHETGFWLIVTVNKQTALRLQQSNTSKYEITFKFAPISFLKIRQVENRSVCLQSWAVGSFLKAAFWMRKARHSVKIMRVDCPRWPVPFTAGQRRLAVMLEKPSSRSEQGYNWALNRVMCSQLQTENVCLNKSQWHISPCLVVLAGHSWVSLTDKHWQTYHLAEIDRNSK